MNNFLKNDSERPRIGFFDSGHGGLDLLREALKRGLKADLFYFADLSFMPYGNKDEALVSARCSKICSFFKELNCEAVVMACNTATAHSIDKLRKEFDYPIVGVEPYLNYVNKMESSEVDDNVVAAIVTPKTLESSRLRNLKNKLDPDGRVNLFAMPGLARAIEDLIQDRDWDSFEVAVEGLMKSIPEDISTLVLGCTHYPLISSFLEKRLGVKTVNPTVGVIDQLLRVAEVECCSGSKKRSFQYAANDFLEWQQRKVSDFIFW